MEQVYYWREGGSWLLSNSVWLLALLTCRRSLDPLGASLFVMWGWAGADRTLDAGVRVVPGGQRWVWKQGAAEPESCTYFGRRHLARRSAVVIEDLATQLVGDCRALAAEHARIECALTGGKDSRLVAALLMSAGVEAQYYTRGAPSAPDVQVGQSIARRFGLEHRVGLRTETRADERWDQARRGLLRQCDGMASLWQIGDVLGEPARTTGLPMGLWGIGGEIARAYWTDPMLFLGWRRPADAVPSRRHTSIAR